MTLGVAGLMQTIWKRRATFEFYWESFLESGIIFLFRNLGHVIQNEYICFLTEKGSEDDSLYRLHFQH